MTKPLYLTYFCEKVVVPNPYYYEGCSERIESKTTTKYEQKVVFLHSDKELESFILENKLDNVQYFEINQIYPKVETTYTLCK